MDSKDTELTLPRFTPPASTSSKASCCLDKLGNLIKAKPALVWFLLFLRLTKLSWDSYLNLRQIGLYALYEQAPKNVSDFMTEEEYKNARVLGLIWHSSIALWLAFEAILTVFIVTCNVLPWLWGMVGLGLELCYSCSSSLWQRSLQNGDWKSGTKYYYKAGEIEKSVAVMILVCPFGMLFPFLGLSLSVWKLLILGVLFTVIVAIQTGGVVQLLHRGGISMKWLYVWLIFALGPVIFFDIILPCFDSYAYIPPGPLKNEVDAFAKQLGFSSDRIYMSDDTSVFGSSNAYYSGLFVGQRVVFTSKLIHRTPDLKPVNCTKTEFLNSEIVAVLAHELGHWKLSHALYGLFLYQADLIILLLVFGRFYRMDSIYKAFGFRNEQPLIFGALIVFYFIALPYTESMDLFANWLSQYKEYKADAFAVELGQGQMLCSALKKLSAGKKMPMDDCLYSLFEQSHPSIMKRCAALVAKV